MNPLLALAFLGTIGCAAFAGRNRLRLEHDAFFMAMIGQALIYVLLAPTLVSTFLDDTVAGDYARLQSLALLFFVLPAILIYRFTRGRREDLAAPREKLLVSPSRAVLLVVFLVVLQVAYVVLVLQSDLLYRRTSTYELAIAKAQLHPAALFIIRSYELMTLPLIALLYGVQVMRRTGLLLVGPVTARIMLMPLLSAVGIFLATSLLNSRQALLLAGIIVVCTHLVIVGRAGKGNALRVALTVLVMAAYGSLLVSNIRVSQIAGGDWTSIANPVYSLTYDTGAYAYREWVRRVDCIDLIQRVEPSLERNGYPMGAAWQVPLTLSVTQFVAPSYASELKTSTLILAKSYLLERYTNLDPYDYYSCSLTDVFGNFGTLGFTIEALLLAAAFAFVARWFSPASIVRRPTLAILALVLATHLIQFEQEFSTYLTGWFRLAPITAFVVLLNPLTSLRPLGTAVPTRADRGTESVSAAGR